ncbi:MAG: hypothetical protein J7K30_14170 [Deltaproteobacteria bacterium]|nr:hypothetical protein [Deltaproteobacteria bacterium]
MEVQSGIEEGMRKFQWKEEIDRGTENWQRWDEEIVEMFGRWLGRLCKAFVIMLFAVLSAIVLGWL